MAHVASREVSDAAVESPIAAVEWGPIFGGALAAIGLTIILFSLGSSLGLSAVSPWSFANPTLETFGVAAGLWLIGTQWRSAVT